MMLMQLKPRTKEDDQYSQKPFTVIPEVCGVFVAMQALLTLKINKY